MIGVQRGLHARSVAQAIWRKLFRALGHSRAEGKSPAWVKAAIHAAVAPVEPAAPAIDLQVGLMSASVKSANSKPLISELEIRWRIAQIATLIADEYQGRPLVLIPVLKGAFIFSADLLRCLCERGATPVVDFIRAASYGEGDHSSGKVRLQLDVSVALANRDVLLVDDIADSGLTLSHLVAHLKRKGAASVKTCVLLDKPSRREVEFHPDFVGFEIPNCFVVGYGIDFAEDYRYLPYITCLESHAS
jgi:hypoxanthine phosphoribosyltransferase